MTPVFSSKLFFLAFVQPALSQGNSLIFSQYAGAPTVTAAFSGPSASLQSADFTICTNYLHGLQPLDHIATTMVPQIEQMQVDGVCQFCTSVEISRVDSCCAQPTSVACFEQFTTDAAGVTTAESTSKPTETKTSDGYKMNSIAFRPALVTILNFAIIGWIL